VQAVRGSVLPSEWPVLLKGVGLVGEGMRYGRMGCAAVSVVPTLWGSTPPTECVLS
jgi:hypothetical protein